MMKYIITAVGSAMLTFGVICSAFFLNSNFSIGESIHFRNADGSFTFEAIPSKGRDHEQLQLAFSAYLAESGKEDDQLYRTTAINYLSINKWSQYKSRPEWQYDYLPSWRR